MIIEVKNNIAFIGFMGVGKTTFGKEVANFFNKNFIDTDERIKDITKMTIAEIFKKYGESYFRSLETKVCKEISNLNGYIISTGGGVIKNQENINYLKKNCTLIHLNAKPLKIYYNIKDNFSRPLLNNCENKLEKINELLAERIELYKKYGDFSIEVNENTIEENLKIILKSLKNNIDFL